MNRFSDDFIKMISESKMAILGTLNTFGIRNILYSSIIENYLKHIDGIYICIIRKILKYFKFLIGHHTYLCKN